ncbi:MAG: hypothetical protein WDM76_03475 [Limisphaerales bacterium]
MKRGIVLLNANMPASLAEAVQCFDRAIELRRTLPLHENLLFRYGLAAGWMNRGDALTRLGEIWAKRCVPTTKPWPFCVNCPWSLTRASAADTPSRG